MLVVGDGIELAETDRVVCDMIGRDTGCCCTGDWRGILADEGDVEKSEVRSESTKVEGSSTNEVRRRIDFGGGPLTDTDEAADEDEELARDESELVDVLRARGSGRENGLLPAALGGTVGTACGEAAVTRSRGFEADESALCCCARAGVCALAAAEGWTSRPSGWSSESESSALSSCLRWRSGATKSVAGSMTGGVVDVAAGDSSLRLKKLERGPVAKLALPLGVEDVSSLP